MSLSQTLGPMLPLLRRYARALTGAQDSGDAFVSATLQALASDRTILDQNLPPRVALYKIFHAIWSSAHVEVAVGDAPLPPHAQTSSYASAAYQRLRALTPLTRQALLLTTIEGFSANEAAQIIGVDRASVHALVTEARQDIAKQMQANVLIIEDETLIALDLSDIVSKLGHTVVATADTAAKAVGAAQLHRPDLVLADIQLADGSSGIEAVQQILTTMSAPVIFITAYPSRLLTGERPEPTFLITKPYLEEAVEAAISQALFFKQTARLP